MGKPRSKTRLEIVRKKGELVQVRHQSDPFMRDHGYVYEITEVTKSGVNGEPIYTIKSIASGCTFGAYERNILEQNDADS